LWLLLEDFAPLFNTTRLSNIQEAFNARFSVLDCPQLLQAKYWPLPSRLVSV
jgi:hypothetical protein